MMILIGIIAMLVVKQAKADTPFFSFHHPLIKHLHRCCKIRTVIFHPNANPSSISTVEVNFDVTPPREIIQFERYDAALSTIADSGQRDIAAFGALSFRANANAQSAEKAALADVQKEQALAETKVQIEQAKSDFEIQRMQQEAAIKKQLMAEEFEYQMKLAEMQAEVQKQKEQQIEDRKDKRVKIQGTQQSELINQRQNDTLPQNFESAGNDSLGGFGLEQFTPQ